MVMLILTLADVLAETDPLPVAEQARRLDEAARAAGKSITYDGGDGVTHVSLDFWAQHKDSLGRVTTVLASFEALYEETRQAEGDFDYDVDWTVRIEGEGGVLYLSGCSCGYGGAGPNGTRRILEELGVAPDRARVLIQQAEFSLALDDE